MTRISRKFLVLLMAVTGLAACERDAVTPEAVTPAPVETAQEPEIQWYDGTVDEAFALAEAEQKPLFFYWGAVWCPPCEQIKATVFKHPTFLAMTELFVPVYLDGDTERAQSRGEQYAVAGYPTMIVFSPEGEEITRIPGWIDSTQYINVLQLALDDATTTTDLLRRALEDPTSVDADAYSRLAFYSWEQDNLPEDLPITADTFRILADGARTAGNTVAWSRLTFHSLYAAAVEHEDAGTDMSPAAKQQARQALTTIFADTDTVLANSDYLLLYFEDFVPLLAAAGADRDMLAALWESTMTVIRDASQLSGAEHIASWYPSIARHFMNNPDAERLPPAMEQEIIAYIDMIEGETRGEARQNVVNTGYQLLAEAKRPDLARELLLAELEKSKAPYYFMSSLGDLAEEAGNYEEAVDWHRRAWEGATGEATRFQWGYQYVNSLVRLTPERGDVIAATSTALLEEFQDRENIFTGRNVDRLQRLLADLAEWQDYTGASSREAAGLAPFYSSLETLCADSSLAGEGAAHCRELYK